MDIILPSSAGEDGGVLVDILSENRLSFLFVSTMHLIILLEQFLKKLFIVSDVSVTDEGSLGTSSPTWLYTSSVDLKSAFIHLWMKHIGDISQG